MDVSSGAVGLEAVQRSPLLAIGALVSMVLVELTWCALLLFVVLHFART